MNRLLERTLAATRDLRDRALKFEAEHVRELEAVEPRFHESARNLLHYLSVRQQDIRPLQRDLHSLGLSSLGVLEPHVLASLNAAIANLERLASKEGTEPPHPPVDLRTGPLLLRDHARLLLGPTRRLRSVRIMVTMPSEAATNEQLLVDLLRAGMEVMRINCAHDDPETWRRMVENLRKAERVVGRKCKIQADLAGPKLRTGAVAPVGKRHQLSGHRTRTRSADGQGSRRPALGRGIRGHGRAVIPAHGAGRRNPRRWRNTTTSAWPCCGGCPCRNSEVAPRFVS